MLRLNPLIHVTTEFRTIWKTSGFHVPHGDHHSLWYPKSIYIYIYRRNQPASNFSSYVSPSTKRENRPDDSHETNLTGLTGVSPPRKVKTVEVTRSHPLSARLLSRRRLATASRGQAYQLHANGLRAHDCWNTTMEVCHGCNVASKRHPSLPCMMPPLSRINGAGECLPVVDSKSSFTMNRAS